MGYFHADIVGGGGFYQWLITRIQLHKPYAMVMGPCICIFEKLIPKCPFLFTL